MSFLNIKLILSAIIINELITTIIEMKIILFGKNSQLAQQFINDFQSISDLVVLGSHPINFQDNIKLTFTSKTNFSFNL